ncbi:unnamed protein product [Caenorhabditis sp. 36 PRJEB53466]|nr:unnamed protein product [Caenorhabditis sp. 36 PRJEB53466]
MELIQDSSLSNDSADLFNDSKKEGPAVEIVKKWMMIAYRLYGNMLDNADYAFFLSVPQLISQLSFLMSVSKEKATGLRMEFGGNPTFEKLAHQIQHQNMLEITEKFMKTWGTEVREALEPGQIMSARRVLCYPSSAVSFHLNTLKSLRRYRVEMKIFEGAKEHRHWVSAKLKKNLAEQVVVNVWEEECMIKETLEQQKSKRKPAGEGPDLEELRRKFERNSPILMWISRANVAILPEMCDSKQLYSHRGTDYFRVSATPTKRISVLKGEMPWNMTILPTGNPRILFVLIYNHTRNLCSFSDLQSQIEKSRPRVPCVIHGYEHENAKENREITDIYFAHWRDEEFHPNRFAPDLRETMDVDGIFENGGFGDLAQSAARPSSGGDVFQIAHLQNFSLLSIFNTPVSRVCSQEDIRGKHAEAAVPKSQLDAGSPHTELVPFPFSVLVWDSERCIPVYMGKITGKRLDDVKPSRSGWKKWLFGWI